MSIAIYREYFKSLLKKSGAKIFYTNLKDLETSASTSFTGIFVIGEEFEKSYAKNIIYKENQKFRRKEKFKRNINFQILIGERDILKVESIFTKFMSEVEDKIRLDNGNVSFLEIGKADYIDKKDTILKSEITLKLDITVTETIYKDYPFKGINWGGDGEYAEENC